MTTGRGKIVLMGSGELTATMVEVHKKLIAGLDPPRRAAFLDTPAGFQLNVDQISDTAVQYFKTRVQHLLTVASFKSADGTSPYDAEQAFQTLRHSDFILIGPGSPTYTVRQAKQSPIPEILYRRVDGGGCLVAASAAALTVGRYTLPVYEIYKVGEDIHWVEGMNILAHFGFNLVVVPHWNNAEGGTHDTRRCFMGDSRFRQLAALLPEEVIIIGLDEHTAAIIDLSLQQVTVKGIGRVVVQHGTHRQVFRKGDSFPASVLRGQSAIADARRLSGALRQRETAGEPDKSVFWEKIHAIENDFQTGLDDRDSAKITNALLELDRAIWQGKQDLESDQTISEAREVLRDLIVVLGAALTEAPINKKECLAPLVDVFLDLRDRYRKNGQFEEADAVRESLQRVRILVEDTPEGVRWRIPE
ncbi:Cysteinyl-tRNA synthetase-like [Olavius algarvensis associated proteobacterium Delta 3]|nr:Cysteinyl-tRNA synthetase-like [Olavius algarvensis associated proteobacterium Delta 3]CAB5155147.1 Cysteinyl-tRNA synthetase-like [Olavius algarvensis associated proteobacterium Delta 3]